MTEHFVYSKLEEDRHGRQPPTPQGEAPARVLDEAAVAGYDINALLDGLGERLGVAGDGALARRLDLSPQLLAGLREGSVPLRPSLLLSFAERAGVPVEGLMSLLGERRTRQRMPQLHPGSPARQ